MERADDHSGETYHEPYSKADQAQPRYPEPEGASGNPYPVLSQSVYGPFPGSRTAAARPFAPASLSLPPLSEPVSRVNAEDDYRELAAQFHIRHGDPGMQSHTRNWHLQTADEQIHFESWAGRSTRLTEELPSENDNWWRAQATAARERADATDGDFQPGDESDNDNDSDSSDNDADDAADDDDLENAVQLDTTLEDLDVMSDVPAANRGGKRGRGRPRKQDSGGAPTTRRRGWRQLLKGTDFEDVGKVSKQPKAAATRGGRRGRPKRAVDPGHRFKEYQKLAMDAWMDGKLDEAADFCRLAIQANPEVFGAYSTLSEILRSQGRPHDALTALSNGANTARSVDKWNQVASRALEVAGAKRDATYLSMAIECYSEALKLKGQLNDELEYDLRIAQYDLYREIGNLKRARATCRSLLRTWPGDIALCREYAELCSAMEDTSELMRAKEAYDSALEAHAEDESMGATGDDAWSHVNIYLELVDLVGQAAEGVLKLKRLARWVLGRKHETFWERYTEDDREFDDNVTRRGLVPEFQSGKASLDKLKYGEGLPIEIRARLGMFRLKMGLSYYNEALLHFQPLLKSTGQPDDYCDVFLQVGNGLREHGFLKEALDFYDPVRTVPDAVDEKSWTIMADAYHQAQRLNEAIECYEEALNFRGQHYGEASARLVKLYEAVGDADKARYLCNEIISLGRRDLLSEEQLKKFPELGKERGARGLWGEMVRRPANNATGERFVPAGEGAFTEFQIQRTMSSHMTANEDDDGEETSAERTAGHKRGRKSNGISTLGSDNAGTSIKRPRLHRSGYVPKRQKVAQERLMQIKDAGARVHANYSVVQAQWAAMLRDEDAEAVEQWQECAGNMLDEFLAMKIFFPDRDRNIQLRTLEEGVYVRVNNSSTAEHHTPPLDFHAIPFAEWHRVFADLALLHARQGEQDKCYKLLQDVLFAANVFFLAPDLDQANYGVGICCALIFNDSQYLIDLSRKIVTKSDFRASAAFQLFAAVNRLTYGSNWFNAGPSQKFMLRMVKQFDYLAMPAGARDRFDWSIHKPSLSQRAARQAGLSHALDAGVLLMYGHMVAVANHSHSAIPYYFRALALAPESACVQLSIATMWVANAMKRQTDNRHFGIAQGLAFLYRYHALRAATRRAACVQEAEFNVARMWHHLGLAHLAMPAYERVLALSADVRREHARERAAAAEASAATHDSPMPTPAPGENGDDGDVDDAEDFAVEAAFALQSLYALAGDDRMARRIGEEWLVL